MEKETRTLIYKALRLIDKAVLSTDGVDPALVDDLRQTRRDIERVVLRHR